MKKAFLSKNLIFTGSLLFIFSNHALVHAKDFCEDQQFQANISKLVEGNGLNGNFVGCGNGLAGPSYESTDGSIHLVVLAHTPAFVESLSTQRDPLLCLVLGGDGKMHKKNVKVCQKYQDAVMKKFFPK